jgi:hypothetical protein
MKSQSSSEPNESGKTIKTQLYMDVIDFQDSEIVSIEISMQVY